MAAGKSEIDSFLSKFVQLLNSGESAQLTFECYNGQYFVNLRAALQHNSEQKYQHHHDHHQQRQRPSPSRLRRRARRRAAACDRDATTSDTIAAKAASADKAESNIETISGKIDVAVQVAECECPVPVLSKKSRDDSISQLVDKAVQVRDQGTPLRSLHHHHQVVQGQRGEAATLSAEQAVRAHAEPAGDTVIADFNQDLGPHPHSPYPHVTHPGRYNYCCEHRCNTGRRRTNSGKRLTDERQCCDHRCSR